MIVQDQTWEEIEEITPVREEAVSAANGLWQVVDRAQRRVAPLWPLNSFVAVNPFLGLVDHSFDRAAAVVAARGGGKMTAPRSFYAEAIRSGRITRADLEEALAEGSPLRGGPRDFQALWTFALEEPEAGGQLQILPTAAAAAGARWESFVTESISRWASTYFDAGQAYWKSPWRNLPPYAAWRAESLHDRTPEVAGVSGFRRRVESLPEEGAALIEYALDRLGVPEEGLEGYLHRLLLSIGGWAGVGRYRLWEAELHGREDRTLIELLAVRLAWEVIMLEELAGEAWAAARSELAGAGLDPAVEEELAGELLLQRAFEIAYQRELLGRFRAGSEPAETARPAVQAAFCIDVRSEVFRRALETVDGEIETIGFAGFFGFPIEYVRLGEEQGGAQCPVLIPPQFVVVEEVGGVTAAEEAAVLDGRTLRRRVGKAWRSFKFGAVSCFGFVGPVGLAYVRQLITDSLGWSRPVEPAATYGLDRATIERLAPRLRAGEAAGRASGMTPAQRLDVAEGVLRAMSLTEKLARLVVLAGHGSTTVNNPYASGLDCGACGGHTGEANARVAAGVLNDPAVRAGLRARGIAVPADTVFVAALHDTTRDEITIFDREGIPASHAAELAQLEEKLAAAGRLARAERAPLLGIRGGVGTDAAVLARSRDWSQVRPEWGLAGCAAFIVAPRARTRGVDLDGRTFLHSYDWRQDEGCGVLELIMTAPMVVASWINLQYYGSTVDNRLFGSGNKVLHNVVGALGVLEGNGGDLRSGLPWQSVHDGEKYVHEPLRLTVLIEAPREAMNEIIGRHEGVRELLDNGWLYLYALDDDGRVSHRYVGDLAWRVVE